jgi:curved DNA-binding protein CbpA
MASTLPPDPYLALGVSKDASAATIKTTYRKLVLKCHPDKVTDESLKPQAQEDFHKIQQAYELIGDENKRATYDAEVRLDQLRREKLARTGGAHTSDVKTARYDVRTAAPAGAAFTATGPHRYEKREPTSRTHEDDRYHDGERSSRNYDTYDSYPKYTSSRTARAEKEPARSSRPSTDRTRSERVKTRDKEERRDRAGKYVNVEDGPSSNDEKVKYEKDFLRRSDEDRRHKDDENMRRAAADARRKAEDRRSYEEPKEPRRQNSDDDREFDRQQKLNAQKFDAVRYITRSKVEADIRPSPSRTSSSRDVRVDSYDRSARRERPDTVRRSSARPKDAPLSSGRDSIRDRNKTIPEIVDWGRDEDRMPPSFKHSSSSPADIQVSPRTTPQRSFTESSRDRRQTSPTPIMRRTETAPIGGAHAVPIRSKKATVARPSGLRREESASPPESAYPAVPPARNAPASTKYYYHTPGGGVSLHPEEVGIAGSHRTVLREPDRLRTRSPSPLGRPPMGAHRPEAMRAASSAVPIPSLGRAATFNSSMAGGEERGRSSNLYGELPSDFTKRENARRQTSFDPDDIAYARKYGPEDVKYGRGSGHDREYAPTPGLSRAATYVC